MKATRVLELAAGAARTMNEGGEIDHPGWTNRYAVLAGCLPEWAQDGATQAPQPTKDMVGTVLLGQDLVVKAVAQWRAQAAPMHAFVQARTAERGLMRLVFGCWRERVEYDAPGINNDASRWRVRKQWIIRV